MKESSDGEALIADSMRRSPPRAKSCGDSAPKSSPRATAPLYYTMAQRRLHAKIDSFYRFKKT